MLWRAEEGTRRLEQSIERWASAMLADDEVEGLIEVDDERCNFTLNSRQNGVLVGAWAVDYLISTRTTDVDTLWYRGDGDELSKGEVIAIFSGGKQAILMLERTILNLLGYLSGIANNTRSWVETSSIPVACTRKTMWGLLDKWAVHLGGGLSHRLSKRDACMLKENDLVAASEEKSQIAEKISNLDDDEIGAFLTVEVRTPSEAVVAAKAWQERGGHKQCVVMLDNMGPDGARESDLLLREQGLRELVILEASGGIVFTSLEEWENCGIEVISTSALNRGIAPHDFSMLIEGA